MLVPFPVTINKKAVGLFYADCDPGHQIQLGSAELSLLKPLSNEAVLAISNILDGRDE
jgi:hypothetical protein